MTAIISTTANIINEFVEQIDIEKEYELKELKQMLSDIYKAKTSPKKEAKQPKKPKKDQQSSDEADESDNDKPKKRGRPAKGPKLDKNGNEKAKREPSAYNKYVKERISALKTEKPETPAKELMLIAASEWKQLTKEEQEQYK
jgi:hypothetical protein